MGKWGKICETRKWEKMRTNKLKVKKTNTMYEQRECSET